MSQAGLGAVLWGMVVIASWFSGDAAASPTRQQLEQLAAAEVTETPAAPTRAETSERVLKLFQAADYAGVNREGLQAIAADPGNHELRLAVANSLAWTGQYAEALRQYEALLDTAYVSQAELGIANITRWRGQPNLALPYYESVLQRDGINKDATEGLALAENALRPKTTFRVATTRDTEVVERYGASVDHQWWTTDYGTRLGLGLSAEEETFDELETPLRELQISVFRPRMTWAPLLELSYQSDPSSNGFVLLQVEPIKDWLFLRAGRINWGRQVFNTRALEDKLTAQRIGIAGNPELGIGKLTYAADVYRVSDDNRVVETRLQLTPRWQPMGRNLSWYLGGATRDARRNDPRYWSPEDGHGTVYIGATYSRWSERYGFYVSLQPGVGVWGEAEGDNSAAAAGGRYQLSRDWAVGIDAWSISNPRPSTYRAHSVALRLERSW